jgi:cytoskeletal protein CcmA (bactofilin family)
MNTYHGRMQGPVDIKDDIAFYGRLDGNASVARGVKLQLHGIVTGDLTIEPDALVELRGRVHGSVTNKGRLMIYGQVGGVVTDAGVGQTTSMWPGAVMAGHHGSKAQ